MPDFSGTSIENAAKIFWPVPDIRLVRPGLGDLSLIPKLIFQFLDHLGQSLSRKQVGGLQREPAGLLQFLLQCFTARSRHQQCSCHLDSPNCQNIPRQVDVLLIFAVGNRVSPANVPGRPAVPPPQYRGALVGPKKESGSIGPLF
jgi:hypothetical protein